MPEPEEILADLPAPNEAEPSSLRQDIADELLDHLQSAARRESLKTSHPEEVEHNVLSRFGNPRQIARQLWFDAMKEKLMLQKITLALVSIVAVASLAACGLMFALARDFQSASTELLSQSREANAELLKQLTAIANQKPDAPSLMEWVPLKIQVVKNDEEKSPGEGFNVTLIGPAILETQSISLEETTGESGIADFGLVRPGSYSATIESPWRHEQTRSLVVKPGSPLVEQVVAPTGPPEEHPVKPVIQWPEEIKGEDVAVLVQLQRNDKFNIEGRTWQSDREQKYLLIRPNGRFATYLDVSYQQSKNVTQNQDLILEHGSARFQSNPEIFEETFPWEGEKVRLLNLKVVKLPQDADFPERGESLVGLSESNLLEQYIPYGRIHASEALLDEGTATQISKEELQKWTIQMSGVDLWVTRAMLIVEQFSDIPAERVKFLVDAFLSRYDQDRNLEISEKEVPESQRESLKNFDQYPISFEAFMKRVVEPFREQKS